MKIAVIIPARYESTRFSGKLMVELNGKPIIEHDIENAKKIKGIDKIILATSDEVLIKITKKYNVPVAIVDARCGSEKAYEYYKINQNFDYYISIPADEPSLNPDEVSRFISDLQTKDFVMIHFDIATFYSDFYDKDHLLSHLSCKIAANRYECAQYFSRSIIPSTKSGEILSLENYKKHIGVFIFSKEFFELYGKALWDDWESEITDRESLEQNRFIDFGSRVKLYKIKHTGFGIDSPEQIKLLEQRIINN